MNSEIYVEHTCVSASLSCHCTRSTRRVPVLEERKRDLDGMDNVSRGLRCNIDYEALHKLSDWE